MGCTASTQAGTPVQTVAAPQTVPPLKPKAVEKPKAVTKTSKTPKANGTKVKKEKRKSSHGSRSSSACKSNNVFCFMYLELASSLIIANHYWLSKNDRFFYIPVVVVGVFNILPSLLSKHAAYEMVKYQKSV